MKSISEIKEMGFKDGQQMRNDSGDSSPGCDGWDGLLINAIGSGETKSLFETENEEEYQQALEAYSEGCKKGAKDANA